MKILERLKKMKEQLAYSEPLYSDEVEHLYALAKPDAPELPVRKTSRVFNPLTCNRAELRHYSVLSPLSRHYREGIVFVVNGEPVGHVKIIPGLDQEKNFLSWIDSSYKGKPVLVKGGLYALPKEIVSRAREQGLHRRKWCVVELEALEVEPRRPANRRGELPKPLSLEKRITVEKKRFQKHRQRSHVICL